MKKQIAIFLFLVLACRPGYCGVQLVYYGLNIDYIIETYCVNKDNPELNCNGKCHLMQQLNLSSPKEDSPAAPLSNINYLDAFFPLFSHDFPIEYTANIQFINKNKALFTYANMYAFLFTSDRFRPPAAFPIS
ncbi:hypothetical protein MWU59_06565 [Flavobacteriaceae bacterium F08102]|nr:hypothetical protein [Flavobacteriaceae bacterium F08102]